MRTASNSNSCDMRHRCTQSFPSALHVSKETLGGLYKMMSATNDWRSKLWAAGVENICKQNNNIANSCMNHWCFVIHWLENGAHLTIQMHNCLLSMMQDYDEENSPTKMRPGLLPGAEWGGRAVVHRPELTRCTAAGTLDPYQRRG